MTCTLLFRIIILKVFPQQNEDAMNLNHFHRSWDEFLRTNSLSTKIAVSAVEHALHCVQCKCSPSQIE